MKVPILGQQTLLRQIDSMIDSGNFPQFSIIYGGRRNGKLLISQYIAERLNAHSLIMDKPSADDVRNVIDATRHNTACVEFIFRHVDDMSNQAVNSMLKLLEEPPKNTYFVFTVRDKDRLLDTIKSRGTEFSMDSYSVSELTEYNHGVRPPSFCATPSDVDICNRIDGLADFVSLVADNIHTVPFVNACKILNRIDLEGTEDIEKYDLYLFLRAFYIECFNRICFSASSREYKSAYWSCMQCTMHTYHTIKGGTNLKMLMDKWLMDVRNALKSAL